MIWLIHWLQKVFDHLMILLYNIYTSLYLHLISHGVKNKNIPCRKTQTTTRSKRFRKFEIFFDRCYSICLSLCDCFTWCSNLDENSCIPLSNSIIFHSIIIRRMDNQSSLFSKRNNDQYLSWIEKRKMRATIISL